jgi:hypothetical protein
MAARFRVWRYRTEFDTAEADGEQLGSPRSEFIDSAG